MGGGIVKRVGLGRPLRHDEYDSNNDILWNHIESKEPKDKGRSEQPADSSTMTFDAGAIRIALYYLEQNTTINFENPILAAHYTIIVQQESAANYTVGFATEKFQKANGVDLVAATGSKVRTIYHCQFDGEKMIIYNVLKNIQNV